MRKKPTILSTLKIALAGLVFATALNIAPVNNTYAIRTDQNQVPTTEIQPSDQPEDNTQNPAQQQPEEQEIDPNKIPEDGGSCTDQTGAIGWLICPTTGVIAKAVDALYDIIQNFLTIDPISFNTESPIYTVWDYCRSITNIIFIILILIVIYSQITGLGLSNYSIKKTLPRLVITAILINLSFILCSGAVDLSNILGANLRDFFSGIAEVTISGSTFDIADYSMTAITSAILAGEVFVAGAMVFAGGIGAFLWMLLPVLLGAIVAVVTGLLTISLRQVVVTLLIAVAPLAIVAYTLPNTEKWFTKWKTTLFQMLIFYPTFSLLFGVSELASIIILSTATDMFGVLLGVAVQIFPLFFAWSLMKMSGSVLSVISNKVSGLSTRPQGAFRSWASSHQALSKARHNATSHLPSGDINRWLEDRKARRESDTARFNASAKIRSQRYTSNVYRRNGQLTRRGEQLYALEGEDLVNASRAKRFENELKEQGYRDDDTDARIRNGRQQKRIQSINKQIVKGVDLNKATDSFIESAKTANAVSYAKRTEQIREKAIAIRNDETLTDEQKMQQIAALDSNVRETLASISNPEERTQYMNNIFAGAISAQTKADKALRDNYSQLYAATQLTRNIHADFNKSFADKNYNSLEAALDELAKRGDFDLIKESLEQHSHEIAGEGDVEMQKHLADTLIKYKNDSAPLWAYAKATNIRRAKHAAKPDEVALFTTFEEFERGAAPSSLPGEAADVTDSLSMVRLIKEINNPAIAVSQDRTTFKYLLQSQQEGILQPDELGFQIKQLRSAASSGQIDGEQLGNLNKLMTGGIVIKNGQLDPTLKPAAVAYIQQNKDAIKANILDYVANMSANQLAGMKESTFNAFNDALMYIDGDTGTDYSGTGKRLATSFYQAIYANAANNMNGIIKSSMNTNIKNWLGIQNNR